MKLTAQQKETLGDIFLAVERHGKPVDPFRVGIFPVVRSLIRRGFLMQQSENGYIIDPDHWELVRGFAADRYEQLAIGEAIVQVLLAATEKHPDWKLSDSEFQRMEKLRAMYGDSMPEKVSKAFAIYDLRLAKLKELRG